MLHFNTLSQIFLVRMFAYMYLWSCFSREPIMNVLNDVKTTCQLLSMSRSALYEAVKEGRIRALKNGSRTLFHRDEIERFAGLLANIR
jgi:excisionase family DNA binding protein